MKDPTKLHAKLQSLLRGHPNLRLSLDGPLSNEGLRDMAWIVQDYVDNSGDVTNDDPLYEWLEEYYFFCQEKR